MPSHPLDLPRPTHLVAFLADARRRGVPFDRAWGDGVWIVCRVARDRDWWLATFAEQREAWRRAYMGEAPTRSEAALAVLVPELVGDLDEDGTGERVCAHCDRPLPPGLKATARYCPGSRCKRAASYERERRISHGRTPAEDRCERKGPTARDGDDIDRSPTMEAAA